MNNNIVKYKYFLIGFILCFILLVGFFFIKRYLVGTFNNNFCSEELLREKILNIFEQSWDAMRMGMISLNITKVSCKRIEGDLYRVVYEGILEDKIRKKKYKVKDAIYLYKEEYAILSLFDLKDNKPVTFEGRTFEEIVNITKTRRPNIYLFVMSMCPYGTRSELTLADFFKKIKDRANIDIYWIVSQVNCSRGGVKLGSKCYSSMHGPEEVLEDARQMCIKKYYGIVKLLDYLKEFNTCLSQKRNVTLCSKESIQKLNIDEDVVKRCINSSDIEMLMDESYTKTLEYSAFGSPTLVVNGYSVEGLRSLDEYKRYICDAFLLKEDRAFCLNIR